MPDRQPKVHIIIHKMWTTYVDMDIDNFPPLKGLKRRRFFNPSPTYFQHWFNQVNSTFFSLFNTSNITTAIYYYTYT